jgi:ABC-type sugar transport system ATPase subunit
MASVSLRGITKRYEDVPVLRDVSLEISDREFMVLVGPSGCGKSTLLRMVAGLEEINEGEIAIGGKAVNGLPPRDRGIAMVFQDYALYPHMSVSENMSFGLRLRRLPKPEIEARVREAAAILQIEHLLQRRPRQISGGQRQRVAIGRAIVRKPEVFLFDEPLSNLDAKLREDMRVEIAKLHRRLRATIVYVTHDQVEAMTLAGRIAVLEGGRIRQAGTPEEVFCRPANLFVAGFIGSPTMNRIPGELVPDGEGARFESGPMRLPLGRPSGPLPRSVILGVRPDDVVALPWEGACGRVRASVEVVELLGHRKNVHLRAGETNLLAVVESSSPLRPGAEASLGFPRGLHLFDAGTGDRVPWQGEPEVPVSSGQ